MIIVKVGEPKNKNINDVWFDPTTMKTHRAQPFVAYASFALTWVIIIPTMTRPPYPNKGDITVDGMTQVPALFDGNNWIPAVPTNYTFPPSPPGIGTIWTESLSQVQYIYFNNQWTELSLMVQGNAITGPNPTLVPSGQAASANHIQIIGPSGTLVTIDTLTGVLTYGSNYTPDAAAQIFWKAIAGTSPRFLQTQIIDLTKDLKDATSRLAIAEGHILKFKEAGHKLPEPPKPFNANDSWERAMGIIK